ncbi:sensor histidine kinase [Geofilum sp. OHC36d9]|uniref:sensor histidine kinase n=1 Tax=Geofilum sp. OHC36d9 TaxID=3458413 RepID=UPI004033CB0C
MPAKINNWYNLLTSYAVWVALALFYFVLGLQINLIRGLFHVVLFVPMQYLVYNLNLRKFMPRYYETDKRKFRLYNAALMPLLAGFGVLAEIVYRHFFTDDLTPSHFKLLGPFILHLILCLMAFWVSMTRYLVAKQEKTNIEIETLKRDKAESELKFLKTQINPHFLFNALNNIYSMAYTGDKSAPEKITMLSDMLRYVLYDCESEFISLYKEIDYISSFLEFQQLKTEKRQNITFYAGPYDDNYQIAPMLLVTFVENGFKHSKIEKNKQGFVTIHLSQTDEKFYFSVENSVPDNVPQSKKFNRGIGIDNARNRLNLLYPAKHKLNIISEANFHKIELELYK